MTADGRTAVLRSSTFRDSALRALSIPITGIFSLSISHLLIRTQGAEIFGLVTLIWSLVQLISFADLGVGAAVTNAIAKEKEPISSRIVEQTIYSAQRVLFISSSFILIVAVVLGSLGAWTQLIGKPQAEDFSVDLAVTLMLSAFAMSLVLGLWQRILLGLDKNTVNVMLGSMTAPIAFLFCYLVLHLNLRPEILAVAQAVAIATVSMVGCLLIRLRYKFPIFKIALMALNSKKNRKVRIADTAVPMAMILIAQPIALYSDRLVLAWRSDVANVASYALAFQLYVPMLAVLTAGAMSIWPKATQAIAAGREADALRAPQKVLFGVGLLLSIGLIAAGPTISNYVGGSQVSVPFLLLSMFALLVMVQAVTIPYSMAMTSARGLRVQAVSIGTMLALALPLKIWLAEYGAWATVAISAVSILVAQTIPLMLFYRYRWKDFGGKNGDLESKDVTISTGERAEE